MFPDTWQEIVAAVSKNFVVQVDAEVAWLQGIKGHGSLIKDHFSCFSAEKSLLPGENWERRWHVRSRGRQRLMLNCHGTKCFFFCSLTYVIVLFNHCHVCIFVCMCI